MYRETMGNCKYYLQNAMDMLRVTSDNTDEKILKEIIELYNSINQAYISAWYLEKKLPKEYDE